MAASYVINGPGDEAAFQEASQLAEAAVTKRANAGFEQSALWWSGLVLAATGSAALAFWMLFPVFAGGVGLTPPVAAFLSFVIGIAVYGLWVFWLNRRAGRKLAHAWCNDPVTGQQQVQVSDVGVKVLTGDSATLFAWKDVTRIAEGTSAVVVMAGLAWGYFPRSGFENAEVAQAALADMRRWKSEAEPT